jgi:hypothetical protein
MVDCHCRSFTAIMVAVLTHSAPWLRRSGPLERLSQSRKQRDQDVLCNLEIQERWSHKTAWA